jgi:hypothetical protein
MRRCLPSAHFWVCLGWQIGTHCPILHARWDRLHPSVAWRPVWRRDICARSCAHAHVVAMGRWASLNPKHTGCSADGHPTAAIDAPTDACQADAGVSTASSIRLGPCGAGGCSPQGAAGENMNDSAMQRIDLGRPVPMGPCFLEPKNPTPQSQHAILSI